MGTQQADATPARRRGRSVSRTRRTRSGSRMGRTRSVTVVSTPVAAAPATAAKSARQTHTSAKKAPAARANARLGEVPVFELGEKVVKRDDAKQDAVDLIVGSVAAVSFGLGSTARDLVDGSFSLDRLYLHVYYDWTVLFVTFAATRYFSGFFRKSRDAPRRAPLGRWGHTLERYGYMIGLVVTCAWLGWADVEWINTLWKTHALPRFEGYPYAVSFCAYILFEAGASFAYLFLGAIATRTLVSRAVSLLQVKKLLR